MELTLILLEARANPSVQDLTGATPLHFAAAGGQIQLAQLLLKHGLFRLFLNRFFDFILNLKKDFSIFC